jgi:hypothetical protein
MNFDFQHILKPTGLVEMQPVKSGLIAVSATKPVANGQTGLNYVATFYERMTSSYFGDWVPKNLVKPSQAQSNQIKPNPTQSNLIQPNPTKKTAWISPTRLKTGMEARNP